MKILVVGSGGREHALIWKIAQSPLVKKIYCAPGNPGISQLVRHGGSACGMTECLPIGASEIDQLKDFAKSEKIDLTVVGPELPLVNGIVDEFRRNGLKIFGPTRLAAQLEGSKAFAKELLQRHGIPTPSFKIVISFQEAITYLEKNPFPVVIKADGLASGKGVVIVENMEDARDTLTKIMKDRVFGAAGDKVVIEEFINGKEVSILALTDGKTIAVLEPAQDYKRLMDNNKGPNTGGMGSYSPVPFVTTKLMDSVIREVFVPTIHAMNLPDGQAGMLGRTYQGVLYAGLMITPSGPKVLEFNVRFGDPETQPLMMRLKSDLVSLMLSVVEGRLDKIKPIEWYDEPAVCVVMTAKGYPSSPKTGDVIEITEEPFGKPQGKLQDGKTDDNIQIFHAGTALSDNKIVTAGGRVLGVTARAKSLSQARQKVYDTIKRISFDGAFYRTDIAKQ